MKRVLITNGEVELNQVMARYLLAAGHRVALLYPPDGVSEMPETDGNRLYLYRQETFEADTMRDQVAAIEGALGGLDVLIHGHEMVDEVMSLANDAQSFHTQLAEYTRRIFVVTRALVPQFIRQKSGAIVFPVIFDALHYDGYVTSPVLDHGKIAFMKCLARELTPFRIQVNALSLGYHDPGFDRAERKERLNSLSIYGLKPPMVGIEELLSGLDLLIESPCPYIGGQTIHIGMGIETTV